MSSGGRLLSESSVSVFTQSVQSVSLWMCCLSKERGGERGNSFFQYPEVVVVGELLFFFFLNYLLQSSAFRLRLEGFARCSKAVASIDLPAVRQLST